MRRQMFAIASAACLSVVLCFTVSAQTRKAKTDAEIKQVLISESIASYAGSCPCPYNRDRGGRSCGKRSAYSKPGGKAPLCYPDDVTQKMVNDYRKRIGGTEN